MAELLLTRFKSCKVTDDGEMSSTLDAISVELGQSEELRIKFGLLDIWKDFRKLWQDLVRAHLTFWDGDDDDLSKEQNKQHSLRSMCAALARFTRNLVAGAPRNQQRAFENEPEIRRLLHYYTSWTAAEDKNAILVARILTQALSNIITANEVLMDKIWEVYLNLPEDQVILIRLLTASDHRTLLAVLILMRNCLHGSRARTKMFTKTTIGARICVFLLDDMVTLYDAEERSDGAKAFDVAYEIFSFIMEGGLVPDLYNKLSIQDEIVTPHQTTLLKLVDSYLQSTSAAVAQDSDKVMRKTRLKLGPMLAGCFFGLSSYAQHSIRRALGSNSALSSLDEKGLLPSTSNLSSATQQYHLSELDIMLPKACEALVLVTQCIITITLEADSTGTSSGLSPASPKTYFNDARLDSRGVVESLIELLRLLDLFLPRINFGRPVVTGPTPSEQHPVPPEHPGFSYVKRDLVRLLGILCHENRAVQDRVRVCGGIEVVMNLCVVDERNPYLREHAIFTLRNILKDNPGNQAVVEEIKPMGSWDESGVLRDNPGAVRK